MCHCGVSYYAAHELVAYTSLLRTFSSVLDGQDWLDWNGLDWPSWLLLYSTMDLVVERLDRGAPGSTERVVVSAHGLWGCCPACAGRPVRPERRRRV